MQYTVVTYAHIGSDFHFLSRCISKVALSETTGIERAGNGRAKLGSEEVFSGDLRTGHFGGSSLVLRPRERRLLRGHGKARNAIYFGVIER